MINSLKYNCKISLILTLIAISAFGISLGLKSTPNIGKFETAATIYGHIVLAQHEMGDGQETHGKNT